MKHSFFKTLLMGAALLMGGVNTAWAENTVQNFTADKEGVNKWTSSASTTNIKFGSTVTLEGVTMTFGGSTYATAQSTNKSSFSEDFWTWNSDNKGVTPGFMPNSGNTSSGVTSIAVDGTLPTNGAVYKFEVSKPGKLTIEGKGGTTSGKIVLVQADTDNKVTAVLRTDAATDKDVTTTYSMEAGTYYFFQLCHGTSNVNGYRYTLKSISFEVQEPVEGLKVWNFEESGWSTISTSSPLGVIQDQLWLSGSLEYDGTNHRYKAAAGTSNQIRFKVKSGQTGRVVIVGKANDSNHGIQLTIGSAAATTVCQGSINKVHTSAQTTCDADKEIVITADASTLTLFKKVAWVPETETNKTITLGSAGFSTFCPMTNVTIPSNVKAYRLHSISGTDANWEQVNDNIIPGLTGVLLVGEGGNAYTFNAKPSDNIYGVNAYGSTSDYYGSNAQNFYNYLVGTYKATSIPASNATTSYYGLVKNTGTFGKVTGNVTIPAGMAYFSAATAGGVHEFVLDFDGTETGIALPGQTTVQQNSQPLYSLSGVRVVGKPAAGIYVQGGKKIVIK